MRTICVVSFALLVLGCQDRQRGAEFEIIIQEQHARYPEMGTQDWYKLIQQAAMGNEHMWTDTTAVYNYLLAEWGRIGPAMGEPLIEIIAPDTSVVRLNLRPFKDAGGDPDLLFGAMQMTMEQAPRRVNQLIDWYYAWIRFIETQPAPPATDSLHAFLGEQIRLQWPAVHHTPAYEAAYQPAYRVLLRESLVLAGVE